jgi:hypothetical protein
VVVIVLIGYFVISNGLFYLYRYLNIKPSSLHEALYVLLQGYDFSLTLQLNHSQLLLLIFIFSCAAAFIRILLWKRAELRAICDVKKRNSNTGGIGLILSMVMAAIIVGRRYLTFSHPPGFDTPIYIAEILQLQRRGIREESLVFFTLSGLFYPLTFMGIDAESIVKFIPILLVILNIFVTYKFVEEGKLQDRRVQSVAAALVPVSLSIIRQTEDLYKSLFTFSLVLALFALYLKYISYGSKLSSIAILLILPYMTLYGIGWILFVLSVLSFSMLRYVRYRDRNIIKKTLFILTSTVLIAIVGFVYRAYAIDRHVASLVSGWVRYPVTSDLLTFLSIQVEQTLIVLFSLLGLVSLVKIATTTNGQTRLFSELLISFCFVLAGGFFATSFNYRILLYMPFSILSAFGIGLILRNLKKENFVLNLFHRGVVVDRRIVVIVLVFTLLTSNALYYEDNVTESTGYPPEAAANSLVWIAKNIGSDIVIIVKEWNIRVNWIPAIIPPRVYRGDSIYVGTVFDFLAGRPSQLAGYPLADPRFFDSFYHDFLVGRLPVLVIDGFYYRIDELEKSLLSPIHKEGDYTVYALRKVNNTTVEVGYVGSSAG